MFYDLFELQRSYLSAMGRLGAEWVRGTGHDGAEALAEWLARTSRIGDLVELPVEAAVHQLIGSRLRHTVEHADPFGRIVRLWTPGSGRRRVVLLAPHSGYATAVLAQLAAALASTAEVLVTDWHDARLVPRAAGPFGLTEQRGAAETALRIAGPGAHLVAVSQSGWAALEAAVVLAAAAPALVPASLSLLGSPIDARRNPTALQRLLLELPAPLVLGQLLVTVPLIYPGAGRPVYPGLYQLTAFVSGNPRLYAHVQAGLLLELLGKVAAGFALQHRDLHALVDVPGELLTDALARWRGLTPDDPALVAALARWHGPRPNGAAAGDGSGGGRPDRSAHRPATGDPIGQASDGRAGRTPNDPAFAIGRAGRAGQVPNGPAFDSGRAGGGGRMRRHIPLLTIEAGADSLIGPGQTHAAHRWLNGADGPPEPSGAAATFTVPRAEHHELFGGRHFWRRVAPRLLGHLDRTG